MKRALLVPVFFAFTLCAQSDLATSITRAQGSSLDQLRELQARVAGEAGTPEQKIYDETFLNYCLASRLRDKEPKQVEALVERSLKVLEPRKDSESLALHAAFIGLKLGYAPMQGMWLSPKALGLYEQAEKLQPGNPRALVLHAVHILHMPGFVGGGAQKAIPLLEAAVKAAEAEPAAKDPWTPRWGKVESYGWLAIAQAEFGLIPLAEATLAKGASLDPQHGFLKYAGGRVQALKAKKS